MSHKSAPNSKSQYIGHRKLLHSDYSTSVLERPPNEHLVSTIVALHPFNFLYLPRQDMTRRDIVDQHVETSQVIVFTNYCLHSDGANPTSESAIRLIAYMVSHTEDFHGNNAVRYKWTDDTDDAKIKVPYSSEEIVKLKKINVENAKNVEPMHLKQQGWVSRPELEKYTPPMDSLNKKKQGEKRKTRWKNKIKSNCIKLRCAISKGWWN